MKEWTYSNEPKFDFIKLPDGTIINVAHVRRVWVSNGHLYIDTGNKNPPYGIYDPDGKVYAWFAERAVEVVR